MKYYIYIDGHDIGLNTAESIENLANERSCLTDDDGNIMEENIYEISKEDYDQALNIIEKDPDWVEDDESDDYLFITSLIN
jgi:hypothetical protein